MKSEYPKWLYHAERGAVIVATPDEHAALGPDWAESPAAAAAPPHPAAEPPPPPHKSRSGGKRK
jgi:hypothetical protein